jgi:glycosyltransferase involved in cell wall biosynthesis
MRLSVDAHALGRHLTGNEVYVRNLLTEYAAQVSGDEILAYVSVPDTHPAVLSLPDSIKQLRISANPFVRLGVQLTSRVRQDRPDLLHVQYTAPLFCGVPVVATVHDVSYVEHPEYFTWARARQLRITVERTVRSAARVIAPSEFSRQSIIKTYGLPPDRVVSIPNGVSSSFRAVSRDLARFRVARRFGVESPFLLTVGDLQPRKNQLGLIAAFEELLRAHPALPHRLVLTGQNTWFADRIRAAARRSPVSERIHFTGWVDDDELLHLYNACDVFVFPSFYEGFGLPVLEAMACGAPVACTGRTAMMEVADSCALTFDPHSTSEIVRSLRDLLLDAELRTRMGRLGHKRAARFTWYEAARKTYGVYQEVAGKRGSGVRAPVSRPRVSVR